MSAPKRFFVDKISEEVALSGEEFRHAKNVLRLSEGDEVTLLDGSGAEYAAIVARTEKNGMLLHVTGKSEGGNETMANVLLLIGALKGDKTELVVQKATELGVNKIGVFSSRYCAAYMNENKLERLNRVSREAAKQCRRSVAPEVVYYGTLEEALNSADGYSSKLFACEFLRRRNSSARRRRALRGYRWENGSCGRKRRRLRLRLSSCPAWGSCNEGVRVYPRL